MKIINFMLTVHFAGFLVITQNLNEVSKKCIMKYHLYLISLSGTFVKIRVL